MGDRHSCLAMEELRNTDRRDKGVAPYQEVDLMRGERISAAMKRRGMKYNCQLCYAIGVSESTLSRWRMGRPLSLKHAVALSYNLGISLDHLLTGSSLQEQDQTFSMQISKLCDTYSRLNAQNQNLSLNLLRRLASRSTAADPAADTGGADPEAGE